MLRLKVEANELMWELLGQSGHYTAHAVLLRCTAKYAYLKRVNGLDGQSYLIQIYNMVLS